MDRNQVLAPNAVQLLLLLDLAADHVRADKLQYAETAIKVALDLCQKALRAEEAYEKVMTNG